MQVITCLTTEHNLLIVGLAALFCAFGSWVTISLFMRMQSATSTFRHLWLALAGISAGATTWCTHFVAMLAYTPSATVSYDLNKTAISLIVAILGATAGMWLAGVRSAVSPVVTGGAVLGASVAAMHYIGMSAYLIEGTIDWRMSYVLLSIGASVGFGIWSLSSARLLNPFNGRIVGSVLFCLAILTLHFTGMGAIQIVPMVDGATPIAADDAVLALSTIGVGIIVTAVALVANLIDIRSNRASMEQMRHMALSDSLTGLPNRAHFSERVHEAIAESERTGGNLAALVIDLDRFKDINDLRGHSAGDQALRIVSARMSAVLRDGEFLARIGGDEFAAVKAVTGTDEALDFAKRLHGAICEAMKLDDGVESIVDGSIGIAIFPDDGPTAESLMGNADLAMYRAKASPTESICVYIEQMDESVRRRRQIISDLRLALGNEEFELHYQIQTSLETNDVVGYEALLRWNHPERGLINAEEFIPTAEETGLILPVGEWIMRRACEEATTWERPHRVAVNLSAVQFAHSDLPGLVARVLADTGLPPSRLELELTETTFMDEPGRNVEILRRLQEMGVSIALDDFGIGYSSLSTLRKFRFDRIKLDKSFISDFETNVQAKAIVRAVIALGRSLDIPILAEGVETEDQLAFLLFEGCNEAQGYLLGRPARLEAATSQEAAETAAA